MGKFTLIYEHFNMNALDYKHIFYILLYSICIFIKTKNKYILSAYT